VIGPSAWPSRGHGLVERRRAAVTAGSVNQGPCQPARQRARPFFWPIAGSDGGFREDVPLARGGHRVCAQNLGNKAADAPPRPEGAALGKKNKRRFAHCCAGSRIAFHSAFAPLQASGKELLRVRAHSSAAFPGACSPSGMRPGTQRSKPPRSGTELSFARSSERPLADSGTAGSAGDSWPSPGRLRRLDLSRSEEVSAQARSSRGRIRPSCATEATRVPSRAKIRPREKPRAPEVLGESCA